MPKVFIKADGDTEAMLGECMRKYHQDLADNEVRVLVLMVRPAINKDGDVTSPSVSFAGAAAAAKCSLVNARDRAVMPYDARIEIDEDQWDDLTSPQQMALLDHELTHLEITRDSDGKVAQTDDLRPKLSLRNDDWIITGFKEVVDRHGDDALECQSFKRLWDKHGQSLFPWAAEANRSKRAEVA